MNAPNCFETAMAYAQKGFQVFPIHKGDKRPATRNGFLDATTSPEQIRAWWPDGSDHNIGIPTAGMLVVDVDPEGLDWLSDDRAKRLSLNEGPWARTPRGGHHFWFRQPDGIIMGNTVCKLARGIDTRANGGYVVVAPSVVNGTAYEWVDGHELPTIDQLSDPPLWLLDELQGNQPRPVCQQTELPDTGGQIPEVQIPEMEIPEVQIAEGQIPEGQRNHTLFRIGSGMRRMGMQQAEIEAALLVTNQGRCNPPLGVAEVQGIAEKAAKYEPNQIARAYVEGHYQVMAQEEDEPSEEQGIDPGRIPQELLVVPGFVGEVVDFMLATAPYPNRELAFMGALCLQAVLAGRKVRDEANNRTAVYALALAQSGAGKDWPRQVCSQILLAIGLGNHLGDNFASGEGIEDRLYAEPNCLFQTDEIDSILNRMNSGNDPRFDGILSTLLRMYTSAGSHYPMRVKASQEPMSISNPNLVLFGTAIPKFFYRSLNERLLTNGFFSRLLIIEAGGRGEGQEVQMQPVPERILEMARYWASFISISSETVSDSSTPEPLTVPHTVEARRLVTQYRLEADHEYTLAAAAGDEVALTLWTRANEKARRLALVYACSLNPLAPVITAEAVTWAGRFVTHLTRRMIFQTRHYTSEGKFAAMCQALVRTLQTWKSTKDNAWMPFWRISRLHTWTEKEHEQVRNVLLDQLMIEYSEVPTQGRHQRLYRIRSPR